nr:uncharacterized protein LOC104100620 [Nicotiana tomentosiformis]
MPEIPKYNGTSDPHEHIMTYTTDVKGNNLAQHEIKSVRLKKFRETLTNGALTWYALLPEHSIDYFKMLADSFIKAHARARKVQTRKADIFKIIQDEWAAEAFTKGLNPRSSDASGKLKEIFFEFQAIIWADVHNCYELKIRIEEGQLGFPTSTKGRDQDKNQDKFKGDFDADRRYSKGRLLPYERTEGQCSKAFRSSDRFIPDRRIDRVQKNRSLQEKQVPGAWDSTYPRLSDYNFNISIVELVSAMRNIKEARFPKQIISDPSQRDRNLWCEYHGTHGHRTRDCQHLRKEVVTILKNGHIREFLSNRAKNN